MILNSKSFSAMLLTFFISFFTAAGSAYPQSSSATQSAIVNDETRAARVYQTCLRRAQSDPQGAVDQAQRWRDDGGGLPARHCLAMGLVREGYLVPAAEELESMAEDLRTGNGLGFANIIRRGDRILIADIYGQAGNIWLLAERPMMAYEAFSQGITDAPPLGDQAVELYIDRARASAYVGEYDDAVNDLNRAELLAPEQITIHVLKASALRALERLDEAKIAVDEAFRIEDNNREALLERGNLFALMGNTDAARADWLLLATLYPDSAAALSAQANIAALDVCLAEEADPNADGN